MLKEHEEIPYRELVDALQELCRDGATGHMFIRTDSNHSSRIAISAGVIKAITFGRFQGQEAIDAIKKINSARFSFSEVAYESRSRRPLPPTEAILAELAEQTWFAEEGRGGFTAETGGGLSGGSGEDIEDNIFAAAQRSVGGGASASGSSPFAAPQGGSRARDGRGVRGIASRMLGRGRAGDRPAEPAADEGALAKHLFGADAREIEQSRKEVADSILAGRPYHLDDEAQHEGSGAGAGLDSGTHSGTPDASETLGVFAAAAGSEVRLDADDSAMARNLFGAAQEDAQARARAISPDAAIAQELFTASEAPVESEDDKVARDLLDAAEASDVAGSVDEADDELARELFTAGASSDEAAERESPIQAPDAGLVGSIEQELFRDALGSGSGDIATVEGDEDIARELFAGEGDEPQDPFAASGAAAHGLGDMSGSQRVFGLDLVDLVVEQLTKPLGPAAPMAVAEVEDELRQVSEAAGLDSILWRLAERIDDPEAAFAFHTEVMESAFG